MNIALSVINDGKTYQCRLDIIRHPLWSNAKRFHEFCRLVCEQADRERAKFGTSYTLDDLSAATTEVFRYMERHWSEFDEAQKAAVGS